MRGGYDGAMTRLLSFVILSLVVMPVGVVAGTIKKDAFAIEEQQAKDARRADAHEYHEKAEKVQELQQQHELEHPEMMFDEQQEDDVDE